MIKIKRQRRNFRHLNQFDRDRIEALLKAGHSQKEIADILKVNPSCISRERKKKRKNGHYDARTAQCKANVRRSNSKYQGMKIERHPKLKKRIIRELKQKRSPDEIAGRMEREKLEVRVSSRAIYRWLYSVWGQKYCRYLCTKRYKKRKQEKKAKREMIPNRVSIEQRSKYGEHAEGDLFVSPRWTKTPRSGIVIVVPNTQLIVGSMMKNRKPSTMVEKVNDMADNLPINDLTWDNGIENKNHEQLSIPSFFCDPHSPWQKPHVENAIGLIRRWFIPKGTNLKKVSEKKYQRYLYILNSKYRKSLGYRSAYEVSLERGMIQKIPAYAGE